MSASRVLVLGGQRSGKSRYAEQLVVASGRKLVYLATAAAGDGEMSQRIALHRSRRDGEQWRTVEEALDLPTVLFRQAEADTAVLVDCLTLWLSNLMAAERSVVGETERLIDALEDVRGLVVIVSNEVGSGVIPDNPLGRRFADALGTLNQRVAEAADRVVLVVAGQPLVLKAGQSNIEAAEI